MTASSSADSLRFASEHLSVELVAMLRAAGPADRGEDLWLSFSDDGGATRAVGFIDRDQAAKVLANVSVDDVAAHLHAARAIDKRKVLFALPGYRGQIEGQS